MRQTFGASRMNCSTAGGPAIDEVPAPVVTRELRHFLVIDGLALAPIVGDEVDATVLRVGAPVFHLSDFEAGPLRSCRPLEGAGPVEVSSRLRVGAAPRGQVQSSL